MLTARPVILLAEISVCALFIIIYYYNIEYFASSHAKMPFPPKKSRTGPLFEHGLHKSKVRVKLLSDVKVSGIITTLYLTSRVRDVIFSTSRLLVLSDE